MKKYTLFTLSILFFAYSCNPPTDENKALQDNVIAIHDEVMPLMGVFVKNSIKIDSILTDLANMKARNPEIDTAFIRTDLLELKMNLDASRESMNDWMHEFEVDHEGKTDEEVKEYLNKELERIKNVKEKFESASKESVIKLKDY